MFTVKRGVCSIYSQMVPKNIQREKMMKQIGQKGRMGSSLY